VSILDPLRFAVSGNPLTLARATGKSYYALLYTDGAVVNEWQPDVDWPKLPRKGRKALRLYCPSGEMVEFTGPGNGEGRFLQLKVAIAGAGVGRSTIAHMIGYIVGTDGQMRCAAWRYDQRRLEQWTDNAYACKWENLGPLSVDHLGIAPA
jgi:hypothetical protein